MLKIGPTDECLERFEQLKLKHKIAYLVFKVAKKNEKSKDEAIVVETEVKKEDTDEDYRDSFIDDLKKGGSCRYGVIDWNNKLLFVAWSPDTAKGKDKMVYASVREAFIESLVGIQIKIQATDDGEISKEEIEKQCKSKV